MGRIEDELILIRKLLVVLLSEMKKEVRMCKQILVLLLIALTTTACAARYNIHPGALNAADSEAYDALLAAEAVIDQARSQSLPASVKELNTVVQSYNVARLSWLTYRGAIATRSPSDSYLAELNNNVSNLVNAIRSLKGAKP